VIPPWASFLLVLILILIFSKYELSIVLSIGALIFAILTQIDILASLISIFTNFSIIFLAIAVAIIPILGGIMEESGLMLELVQKMNVSKKISMMVVPAFFGLLPVAGGALMSAPILDQIDKDVDVNRKVAINVWFRHVLILIYPISSAMIVASVLTGISLYLIFIALMLPFILMVFMGYILLVKNVKMNEDPSERDLKKVFHNMIPIVIAPLIDFIGRTFFNVAIPEIFLLIGLIVSLGIALKFANMKITSIKNIAKKMKIWRFPLLIFAMFWFLDVFIRSGVAEEIGSLNLSFILFILLGFFLGFATGRIQLPLSILIPIYLSQYITIIMPLMELIFLYCSIFLGYLITPIHPCVAYSTNYFKTNYKNVFKHLAIPTFLCFGLFLLLYTLINLF
jgi:integral membrane protein (TIGR00529 family)